MCNKACTASILFNLTYILFKGEGLELRKHFKELLCIPVR